MRSSAAAALAVAMVAAAAVVAVVVGTRTASALPCDSRLSLSSAGSAQLAVFRPKVDEISLLTVNTTSNFDPANAGGYMVAFAGRKYAARSLPCLSLTAHTQSRVPKGHASKPVLETDGCSSCSGQSSFHRLTACVLRHRQARRRPQLMVRGVEPPPVLLYGLYSNLRDSLTGQFNKFF
uniref:Uncharacterized protein n=1 Tax=Ananas comosus var. bracteatus TaxID=296719 RepID=A0A6V7NM15_ANACO|nr:unnamed protein product [Ananas comosus var. bracteatus]